MYPAATIYSPHRRSSWADAGRGKGVVIQGLKGGEPRFVAATGVMPHGGSAAGKSRKSPNGRPTTDRGVPTRSRDKVAKPR